MQIQLILDPNSANYQEIVDGLEEEFAALRGLEYTRVTEPAPPRTLAVDHNVLKFVFEHPQVITLVTSVIQLTRSVIERIGVRPQKDTPQAVVVVGERSLKIPSSAATEKRFISALAKRPKSETRTSPKGKKKTKKAKSKGNPKSKARRKR